VGIGWYVSQQTGQPGESAQVNAAPIPKTLPVPVAQTGSPADANDKAAALDSLRSQLASAEKERDRALEQSLLQAKELDFLMGRVLASPPRTSPSPSGFSGLWMLPLPRETAAASAFTPEAVDLILNAQQDTIQGLFRARYPGMGAPDPPMMRFYFKGRCEGSVASATWNGEGGSGGEIQLKLASDNALHLVWSTTQVGKESAPDSGTLALVRKLGP
jgi:hypothetical protein